jgi:hypothetical protein
MFADISGGTISLELYFSYPPNLCLPDNTAEGQWNKRANFTATYFIGDQFFTINKGDSLQLIVPAALVSTAGAVPFSDPSALRACQCMKFLARILLLVVFLSFLVCVCVVLCGGWAGEINR